MAFEFGTGRCQPERDAPEADSIWIEIAGKSEGGSPTVLFAGATKALPTIHAPIESATIPRAARIAHHFWIRRQFIWAT